MAKDKKAKLKIEKTYSMGPGVNLFMKIYI